MSEEVTCSICGVVINSGDSAFGVTNGSIDDGGFIMDDVSPWGMILCSSCSELLSSGTVVEFELRHDPSRSVFIGSLPEVRAFVAGNLAIQADKENVCLRIFVSAEGDLKQSPVFESLFGPDNLVDCECCGHRHPAGYDGECRNDEMRF